MNNLLSIECDTFNSYFTRFQGLLRIRSCDCIVFEVQRLLGRWDFCPGDREIVWDFKWTFCVNDDRFIDVAFIHANVVVRIVDI